MLFGLLLMLFAPMLGAWLRAGAVAERARHGFQPKRPCRYQPSPPECQRQALAVDPDQRAVGRLGDEVVALGERTVPPAGLDPLRARQQLQRTAVEQRPRAAARQAARRLRLQPDRPRQQRGRLGRCVRRGSRGGPSARAPPSGSDRAASAAAALGPVISRRTGAAPGRRRGAPAAARSIASAPRPRSARVAKSSPLGAARAAMSSACRRELERRRRQLQPGEPLAQQHEQVRAVARRLGERDLERGACGVRSPRCQRARGASAGEKRHTNACCAAQPGDQPREQDRRAVQHLLGAVGAGEELEPALEARPGRSARADRGARRRRGRSRPAASRRSAAPARRAAGRAGRRALRRPMPCNASQCSRPGPSSQTGATASALRVAREIGACAAARSPDARASTARLAPSARWRCEAHGRAAPAPHAGAAAAPQAAEVAQARLHLEQHRVGRCARLRARLQRDHRRERERGMRAPAAGPRASRAGVGLAEDELRRQRERGRALQPGLTPSASAAALAARCGALRPARAASARCSCRAQGGGERLQRQAGRCRAIQSMASNEHRQPGVRRSAQAATASR